MSCGIRYKVSSLCHFTLSEGGSRSLSGLLHLYKPSRQLRSSSDSSMLFVPTTNRKTFGERSFSFTGPTVWNNLPFDIRSINSIPSFGQTLKTHLFQEILRIQLNSATALFTFSSACIVHLTTCNSVIHPPSLQHQLTN